MITVGIPTYNEGKVIANCLYSILKQIDEKDEIIVVASGCTDNTPAEVARIRDMDKRVKLFIESERRGKSSAINIIIKNAKSDIIVQTDGDVIIGENSINLIKEHFKNPEVGGVSGCPVPIIPKNNIFYDWTIMSYKKADELRKKEFQERNFWHLSGYLCAFRKKALPEVPFAKGAVDALMGYLIKKNGYNIIYEPGAKVFVKAPTNVRDFIRQKARVRAGFYFLNKNFRQQPRTVKPEVFYFPREIIKIKIYRWPAFFFSAFIYAYSWIKGYFFYKKNKSLYEIWKPAHSTKH